MVCGCIVSRLAVTGAGTALIALLLSQPRSACGADKSVHWVGTWACAPLHPHNVPDASTLQPPESSAPGVTIREIAHASIGGETVRVRFRISMGLLRLFLVPPTSH